MVANNIEKYPSFSVGKQLVFIDSFQFMSSSLEALVNNLTREKFTQMNGGVVRNWTCYSKRECTHTNTWTKDSRKNHYQEEVPSTAHSAKARSNKRTTTELKRSGKGSTWKTWVSTTTCTWKPTYYCWLTSSKTLGQSAWNTMVLTHCTTCQLQD
jgi:hypothetical protein